METKTYMDARVEIRESPVHGMGMFALSPIEAGETLVVWGGIRVPKSDVWSGKMKAASVASIGEDTYLVSPADDPADYMNHSCDSNAWMQDEVTLVARRDVVTGEELTVDYALFEGSEEHSGSWQCRCGSSSCRQVYTGRDWRLPELQQRYAEHFSPFINNRIRQLNSG